MSILVGGMCSIQHALMHLYSIFNFTRAIPKGLTFGFFYVNVMCMFCIVFNVCDI